MHHHGERNTAKLLSENIRYRNIGLEIDDSCKQLTSRKRRTQVVLWARVDWFRNLTLVCKKKTSSKAAVIHQWTSGMPMFTKKTCDHAASQCWYWDEAILFQWFEAQAPLQGLQMVLKLPLPRMLAAGVWPICFRFTSYMRLSIVIRHEKTAGKCRRPWQCRWGDQVRVVDISANMSSRLKDTLPTSRAFTHLCVDADLAADKRCSLKTLQGVNTVHCGMNLIHHRCVARHAVGASLSV